MVFKIVCSLLFVVNIVSFAQSTSGTQDALLEQLKRRTDIKVTEVEKDILKIEYPNGEVIYENIGEYTPKPINSIIYSPTYDSTIIDLRTIDTSHFYQKYSFSQEVSVGSQYNEPPLIGDVNNNGLAEIYGIMKSYYSGFSDVVVMEMNINGIFDSVYSYDSTCNPRVIYDINKDGSEEIPFRRYPSDSLYQGHSWVFFKKTTDSSLATKLSFIFYPFPENNQLNKKKFGDWDGDEFTDQIFLREYRSNIHVYEYNPLSNNFDSVYSYDPFQYAIYFSGFAIGDFDGDGYTEFFSGGVNGKVVSIENCGNNCYETGWHGFVETNAAYLYAATNDIDGNGKPEVWIGGYHFQDGEAITRITIFEANGNNNYHVVGKIDIIGGAFNFNAKNMQVLDVDKDGKEEVMLCIEQHVIILKFNGDVNRHTYEIFYLKRNDLAFSGRNSVIYGATMYDITNDGKEDIIIHYDEIIPDPGMRLFTYIYKADFSVDVKNEEGVIPNKFQLHQNYPNPFNPVTKIRFDIPLSSQTTVKVYNILGKEITVLLDENMQPGSYEIDWDATDINRNKLPSGVYIIKLSAFYGNNIYTKTIKTMLLK